MSIVPRKATIAIVKMGILEIEGLRFEDNGEYAIAQQQVATLFSVIPTSAPKWLKGILGAGFQLFRVTTDRNKGTRQNRSESALSILDFERVVRALDRKGNEKAQAISDSLVGLALTQLFSDAFGIEFDKHDRQEYLTARLAGKITRRTLTDAIKEYLGKQNEVSENYRKWIYSNCSDKINLALFDKKASQLKKERSCKDNDALRDTHSKAELVLIDRIEGHAVILIDRGMEPQIAVSDAIAFYG